MVTLNQQCTSQTIVSSLFVLTKQQETALKIKELGGAAVKCHVPGELNQLKGMTTGVPVSLSDEVLKTQIINKMVMEVKRLQANRNGRKEISTTVVITFKCKKLLERIKIGYMSYMVRPYVRPVM